MLLGLLLGFLLLDILFRLVRNDSLTVRAGEPPPLWRLRHLRCTRKQDIVTEYFFCAIL